MRAISSRMLTPLGTSLRPFVFCSHTSMNCAKGSAMTRRGGVSGSLEGRSGGELMRPVVWNGAECVCSRSLPSIVAFSAGLV